MVNYVTELQLIPMFINRKALQSALKYALKLVPSRPTHPILASVVLESNGEHITLRATDLKQYIVIQLKHENTDKIEPFSVAVPAVVFANAVAKLKRDELILTMKDGICEITGESTFHIRTADSDEYPEPPEQTGAAIDIAADGLYDAINAVRYAASHEEKRQVLCGVNFWSEAHDAIEDGTMLLAATDGHRLAIASCEVPDNIEVNKTITNEAITSIHQILSTRDLDAESVGVTFGTDTTVFDFGDILLYARNLDGSYPYYIQLLTSEWDHTIDVEVKELINILEQAQIIADHKTGVITMKMSDMITVSVDAADVGDFKGYVSFEETDTFANLETPYQIGFQTKYVLEALKAVSSDSVTMKFNSPTSSMVMTDEIETHLIMPVTIRD